MAGINATRAWLALSLIAWTLPALAGGSSLTQSINAAKKTATSSAACVAIAPFYWEIGDKAGALGNGSVGVLAPSSKTPMPIYSAAKWIYAAYVVAYRAAAGQPISADDIAALNMTAGYTDQGQCQLQPTVSACLQTIGNQDASSITYFFYGPGHFEKSADSLGLGSLTASDLAVEISRKLGGGFALGYQNTSLAAGAISTAGDYAVFLRRLMNGTLMPGLLGTYPVCTYTGATAGGRTNCPFAKSSPAAEPAYGLQESWDYSLGHWVENDPVNRNDLSVPVDAYSSPGAAGFYPWIDGTRTTYGIVARAVIGDTSSAKSVLCGRRIRKAWMTGVAQ